MRTIENGPALRVAIVGIGGFGAAHHAAFLDWENQGDVKIVATCDPSLEQLEAACLSLNFAGRGVAAYPDFAAMLDAHQDGIDLCVVAAPIQFHASMHEALVRRHIPCYLEKPPTLDPGEFQRMLIVEREARVPTNVGFGFIYQKSRIALKLRIVRGEFGTLTRAGLSGFAQRKPAYFRRNNWAGKLLMGERLLLDSCLGNAMSHYLNSLLFLSGTDSLYDWSGIQDLSCELYRANPIESTDTIFAHGHLRPGIEVRIAATHACANPTQFIEERLEFEKARLIITNSREVHLVWNDGRSEDFNLGKTSLTECVGDYLAFLQNQKSRPAQLLSDCQGFIDANTLFYVAAKQIHDIPESQLEPAPVEEAVVIRNVRDAATSLLDTGILPSLSGYAWGQKGGSCTLASAHAIETLVKEMARSCQDAQRRIEHSVPAHAGEAINAVFR